MNRTGLLETMAHEHLDALLAAVGAGYRPGAVEMLAAADPEWREALEQTEREVGALYGALCEADATLTRWRQAVGELYRLWARVHEVSTPVEALPLEEVA